TAGIEDLRRQHPTVRVRVDTGYRGLAKAFPAQVSVPPLPPAKDAPPDTIATYQQARKQQSSRRVCIGQPIATVRPRPPAKDAPPDTIAPYQQARKQQSSRRICIEHAIAEHKQWRPLQRYLGRREAYSENHPGIAHTGSR